MKTDIMTLERTHNCGELRESDIGKRVTLMGWVNRRRDHGGVIFVDLRDRWGITQVVFNPEKHPDSHRTAEKMRNEWVIGVSGIVEARPEGMINPKMDTGVIDVFCDSIEIYSSAKTPPFMIEEDTSASEELRLKYRYLDLRRADMQRNLILRHRTAQVIRRILSEMGFIEIETPALMKSTPEGARDYLVPSRLHHGKFYALPQSPQTYKQILMVSGFDRYFQIVKCFRDEDLRADRQPEFTQLDIEMTFVNEEDIFRVVERVVTETFREILGMKVVPEFPRMTYDTVMEHYGVDKPDTRFGLEIVDLGDILETCTFRVFRDTLDRRGHVKGINVKACSGYSRKQIDDLIKLAQELGAGGLAWIKVTEKGPESSIVKFFSEDILEHIIKKMKAEAGDLLIFIADEKEIVNRVLASLRIHLGNELGLIKTDEYSFLWVTDFPLFDVSQEDGKIVSAHHPFTMPHVEDLSHLEKEPFKVRSRAYDLILNGCEVFSGSIRIHDSSLQRRIFKILGIDEKESAKKFGFLLEAFEYGAPPHGGIAMGFDRFTMILAGCQTIRDMIAFPKTGNAVSLMEGTPAEVDKEQLVELGLKLRKISQKESSNLQD